MPIFGYRFDEMKATQAAALFLELAGGRENYTKLIKLLYLLDREALIRQGHRSPATVLSRCLWGRW